MGVCVYEGESRERERETMERERELVRQPHDIEIDRTFERVRL